MIRNIIFDWSGTLVNDLPGVWKATNHVLKQAGVPALTLDEFRNEFQLPFTRFYERFTPDIPLETLEGWFHGSFREVCGEVTALPHANEFLEFCKTRKIRCFILSTVNSGYFTVQAANAGMDGCFEKLYLGIWDKREKIDEIIQENNLLKDETLYIGDMQHDIETAHHGDIHSCALLTGYNTLDQLRQSRPTIIVTHLDELKTLLLANDLSLPIVHGQSGNDRRPIPTVGALIYNALGQVLMVRTDKWSGKWGIPGGKIEYGETSVEALRREVAEETSLQIADIEFVLSQDCINSAEFYRPEHFILLNYTCRCAGETDVTLNEEAQTFCWVSESEALALALNKPTRTLLDAVTTREPEPIDA
ncbi:MAG: NUDIX domain-containing protein [Verrucomicrobiota bacterium]|jgi:phosphoglycolate phosphatase-like HAD superfamily hydrolase/ADP-ribose pyrophosphatase YjhB (NUDIX family)|nr:NUDIX domain-containing protein [Verrucomicrobiota bacterium]